MKVESKSDSKIGKKKNEILATRMGRDGNRCAQNLYASLIPARSNKKA